MGKQKKSEKGGKFRQNTLNTCAGNNEEENGRAKKTGKMRDTVSQVGRDYRWTEEEKEQESDSRQRTRESDSRHIETWEIGFLTILPRLESGIAKFFQLQCCRHVSIPPVTIAVRYERNVHTRPHRCRT